MFIEKVKIYTEDQYYRYGLTFLIDEILIENSGILENLNIDILIFTEKYNFSNFNKILNSTNYTNPTIIIGDRKHLSFFEGVTNTRCFMIKNEYSVKKFKKILISALWLFKANISDENNKKTQVKLKSNEVKIIDLLIKGFTPKSISLKLSLSQKSISNYKRSAMMKLKAENTIELLVKYRFFKVMNVDQ